MIGNWFVGATAPRSVGRALVISGEPGIGKTAVLDAWLQGMSGRIIGLRTRCSPEQILPFEAFAPLLSDGSPIDRPDDLRTRRQLFNTIIGRLRTMADGRAIVLAIDDAHWLTASSVSLLGHLVAQRQVDQLRVVLTLRQHELAANEPLTPACWPNGRQPGTPRRCHWVHCPSPRSRRWRRGTCRARRPAARRVTCRAACAP